MNKKRLKVIDWGDQGQGHVYVQIWTNDIIQTKNCDMIFVDLDPICVYKMKYGYEMMDLWFWAMFQGCEVCGWLCFYFVYVDWDLLLCGDPAAIVVFVNHSEVLKYCIIFLLLLSRILKKTTMYTSCMYIIILVRSVTSI